MKQTTLILICWLLTGKQVCGQPPLPREITVAEALKNRLNREEPFIITGEIHNYVGKNVYLFDTVAGTKQINDTLRLLFIGKNAPKQLLTILLRGTAINTLWPMLKEGRHRFNGKVILYKRKPAIELTNTSQLATLIQI